MSTLISVAELRTLGIAAFLAAGVSAGTSAEVVEALVDAELDGIASHGFSRLPFYADQALSGKVNVRAVPVVLTPRPSAVMVDACNGFAFPAINAGLRAVFDLLPGQGICALGVTRSHHCGVLGHFVEKAAAKGYIGIAFANTPAAMAPWGGSRAAFGTNPLAFGCPRGGGDPVVIDLSLSKVARGKIMLAKQRGETIPSGWALDSEGNDTTDPDAALQGTMVPLGEAKGAALAMMVEVLAATLTGANHASEASSFFEATGPAPGVGQFFIFIDPQPFNANFLYRMEVLCREITGQKNTRLPGARRQQQRQTRTREGIHLPEALLADLRRRAETALS